MARGPATTSPSPPRIEPETHQLTRSADGLLGSLRQRRKRVRTADCEIGECLAIQLHTGRLEAIDEPRIRDVVLYVRTARSKGLPERIVIVRHALRNALVPVLTILGIQFGAMLSGAVVTETVFSRPGLGRLVVSAILWKDYPLVQGIVLFMATTYVVVNLAVDVCAAWLDPRTRYGGT